MFFNNYYFSSAENVIGFTGTLAKIEASGTETEGTATLDGYNLGLGIKGETSNGLRVKMNLQYTDFEDLSLSSSTNNSISADLDVTALNFSVGKAF